MKGAERLMSLVEESKKAFRAGMADPDLDARLKRVRLLLTDVDGVMTDGSVFITHDNEIKQFDIQDGLGLVLMRRMGFKIGWISARPSVITQRRAEELKIDYLIQRQGSKVGAAEEIMAQAGLKWEDVCYVGDDVVDLCLMNRAGVAVAVANAIPEVKAMAHYVTERRGGHGAVREVATMIMKAQGKWEPLLRELTE
jgi:3-deoxy-D-manno-octulosonate 8-phosphate phosphatase (KDO 8-P phosphatase)